MKRVLIAAVAMIICVGVVVGLVSGAFATLVEGGLYASGLWSRNGPSTLAPSTVHDLSPAARAGCSAVHTRSTANLTATPRGSVTSADSHASKGRTVQAWRSTR